MTQEQSPATPSESQQDAAEAFVQGMIPRQDFYFNAGYLWHGWALRDAFHAGATFARSEIAPSAWSPISKSGLLRGIRHGKPSDEDLAIAEADGDTIRYFYDAPSETIPSAIETISVEQAVKMASAEYLRGLEDAALLCEGKSGVWPLDIDGSRDSEWGMRYAHCIRDLNPEPQRG